MDQSHTSKHTLPFELTTHSLQHRLYVLKWPITNFVTYFTFWNDQSPTSYNFWILPFIYAYNKMIVEVAHQSQGMLRGLLNFWIFPFNCNKKRVELNLRMHEQIAFHDMKCSCHDQSPTSYNFWILPFIYAYNKMIVWLYILCTSIGIISYSG
jgi:hypothetical protein